MKPSFTSLGIAQVHTAILSAVCRQLQGDQFCVARQESVNSAALKSSRRVTSCLSSAVGTCALHAPPRSALHALPRPDSTHPPFSSPSFASAAAAYIMPIYP
jgi:hypothetical protein